MSTAEKVIIIDNKTSNLYDYYWALGFICSIIGALLIFAPWFEAAIIVVRTYSALDIAFGSAFQPDGFWENFDVATKYCGVLIGLLSCFYAVWFLYAKKNSVSSKIIVLPILIGLLLVLHYDFVSPITESAALYRHVGSGFWVYLVMWILMLLFTHLIIKMSKGEAVFNVQFRNETNPSVKPLKETEKKTAE